MRKDWIEIEIGMMSEIQNGYAFKSKNYTTSGYRIIRIGNVQRGFILDKDPKFYPKSEVSQVEEFILNENDILISLTGNVGRVGRIKSKMLPALLNQRVGRFELKESTNICDNYFFVFLNSKLFEKQVIKSAKGVAQLNTSSKKIKKINFPFPPLPEQKAIVAKIEQLFSDLDNGIANLKKVQEQLKIYRQAVLKKAFEGELTKEWREAQNMKSEQKSFKSLSEIGEILTGNTPSKKITDFYSSKDYPFYKPTDLNAGNNVTNSIDGLSELGFQNGRIAPANSILVTCIGATIGKTGLIKKEGCFNQQINAIVPFKENNSRYIFYQAISVAFQNQIKANASATTLPILNKGKFSNLAMIMFPFQEQTQIVQEIESRLSVCNNVEANIKSALEKAESLRQSILKKAFEGKLLTEAELQDVKNDPEWEPAEKLLERIKEEKKNRKNRGKINE